MTQRQATIIMLELQLRSTPSDGCPHQPLPPSSLLLNSPADFGGADRRGFSDSVPGGIPHAGLLEFLIQDLAGVFGCGEWLGEGALDRDW